MALSASSIYIRPANAAQGFASNFIGWPELAFGVEY
jgi:hypothetical protein